MLIDRMPALPHWMSLNSGIVLVILAVAYADTVRAGEAPQHQVTHPTVAPHEVRPIRPLHSFAPDDVSYPAAAPHEDLLPTQDGTGKWGYVRWDDYLADADERVRRHEDEVGVREEIEPPKRWHIAPQFDHAWAFHEGAAPVAVGKRWGFIDEDGRFITEPQYQLVSAFRGGFAAVCVENRWGYVNRRGEVVIPAQFEYAQDFSEGLAAVRKDGMYGYINALGVFVIAPQFDDADCFHEGAAVVSRSGKLIYIRRDGEPLTEMSFDLANPFAYGRATVGSGDRWGVLDNLGQLVVPITFEEISYQFSEGMAAAKVDGKWGFIDVRGTWVIPPTYHKARDFRHGLAVVVRGEDLCVIDPLGHVKWRAAKISGEAKDHAKPGNDSIQ